MLLATPSRTPRTSPGGPRHPDRPLRLVRVDRQHVLHDRLPSRRRPRAGRSLHGRTAARELDFSLVSPSRPHRPPPDHAEHDEDAPRQEAHLAARRARRVSTRSATPIARNTIGEDAAHGSIGHPVGLRADHDPAVGVAQHVVDDPPEHALAAPLSLLGAEHDDLGPAPAASSTIASPTLRVRTMRVMTLTPYWLPSAAASRSSRSACCRLVVHRVGQRPVQRHLDRIERDELRARLRRQPQRRAGHLVRHPVRTSAAGGSSGTRPRPPGRAAGRASTVSVSGRCCVRR